MKVLLREDKVADLYKVLSENPGIIMYKILLENTML